MAYNLAAIRKLVAAAFNDEELRTFCFDHFPAVYEEFAAGQAKGDRVLSLVSYAERQGQLDTLLDAIKQANPYQFDRFEADVRSAIGPEALSDDCWRLIPGGRFLMGADAGDGVPEHETPRHPVPLPAYRIGKYPVTNAQYAEFIRREKTQDVPKDAGWFLREPPADRLDHPVANVSWYDAVAYCQWLCRETGQRYRLPTEAEWEKACSNDFSRSAPRRTTEVVTTNRYPWGEEWSEGQCNAGGAGTTPVTAHPAGASAYGCEDMLGNVQEWTATLWGTQPGQPQQSYRDRPDGGPAITDPADLPAQARLAHRGGSYRSQPADLRCTARGNATPDSKVAWRGFRVAMEV